MANRVKGTVDWFHEFKGYGAIRLKSGEQAFFSTLDIKGSTDLRIGNEVEFEIEKGLRGIHAKNIMKI